VAEVINGIRYLYAGFDNCGYSTIQAAIAAAVSGNRILIRGGRSYSVDITVKNGVSIYGGYNENGIQDFIAGPTVINGRITANA